MRLNQSITDTGPSGNLSGLAVATFLRDRAATARATAGEIGQLDKPTAADITAADLLRALADLYDSAAAITAKLSEILAEAGQ